MVKFDRISAKRINAITDLYGIFVQGQYGYGLLNVVKDEFLKVLQESDPKMNIEKICKSYVHKHEAALVSGDYNCHIFGFGDNKIKEKKPKEGFLELVEELKNGAGEEKLVSYGMVDFDKPESEFGGWYITQKK